MVSEELVLGPEKVAIPINGIKGMLADKMRNTSEFRSSFRRMSLGLALAGLLVLNMALSACASPTSRTHPTLATRTVVMNPYIEESIEYLSNDLQASDLRRLESEASKVNSTSFYLKFIETTANMYGGECSGGGINIHGRNYVITADHCLLSSVPITQIELSQPHINHTTPLVVDILAQRIYSDLDVRIFRVDTGGVNFPEVEVNKQGYISNTPIVSLNVFPNGEAIPVVNVQTRILSPQEMGALGYNTSPEKWLIPVEYLPPGSSGAIVFDNSGKLIGTLIQIVKPSKGVPLGALFVENPNLSELSNLP